MTSGHCVDVNCHEMVGRGVALRHPPDSRVTVLVNSERPHEVSVLDGRAIIEHCRSAYAQQFYEERQHLLCRDPHVYLRDMLKLYAADPQEQFVDACFPPNASSLYCEASGRVVPQENRDAPEHCTWKRLSEVYPGAVVFGEEVTGDIQQGALGDCWCAFRPCSVVCFLDSHWH